MSYNPATGEETGRYSNASAQDILAAVGNLRRRSTLAAGLLWSELPLKKRIGFLSRLRSKLASNADELAELVSTEIGKPLQEAYGADILPALDAIDWLCKAAPKHLRNKKITRNAALIPEPLGVIGVIGTWNYPIFLNVIPIVWALMAGNSVVWKPSELATETALRLKTIFNELSLPVAVVLGDGTSGQALCKAGCDKVVFTGGVATGRAILQTLAEYGTPAVMELSGNDAMLVCKDADIPLAARSAVWGRCSSAGQSCVAPQRIYVDEKALEEFLKECRHTMHSLVQGIDFGPMRTFELRKRAETLVCQAIDEGAKLLVGGVSDKNTQGFFMSPTLLTCCCENSAILKQDFFGPVLAVQGFNSIDEAVRLANGSEMGLGASVWTEDEATGKRIAAAMKAGLVSINQILLDAADPALPFGGVGASGFGKQRGIAGLDEFVHWKAVATHSTRGERRHLFPHRAETVAILSGLIALKSEKGFAEKWNSMRALMSAVKDWKR